MRDLLRHEVWLLQVRQEEHCSELHDECPALCEATHRPIDVAYQAHHHPRW